MVAVEAQNPLAQSDVGQLSENQLPRKIKHL
jgi:hypothetical protein